MILVSISPTLPILPPTYLETLSTADPTADPTADAVEDAVLEIQLAAAPAPVVTALTADDAIFLAPVSTELTALDALLLILLTRLVLIKEN